MSQKYLLLLVIALAIYTGASQDVQLCSQYNCLNFSKNWPAAPSTEWDYCAMANKFVRTNSTTTARWREFAMKSCNTSADGMTMYTCPIDSISTSSQYTVCKNNTQPIQPAAKLLPGNNCTTAEQCLSGTCDAQTQRCKGATSSSFFNPCASDSTCDVGYSCQGARCTQLKQLGEACTLANECVPYAVCATGICRKYFSVDVGEEVGSVTNDPRACISVEFSPNDKVCELETTRAQVGPIGQKPQNDVCQYKDNSGGLDGKTKNSVCGYGPTPSAFCPIGHGEKEFKDVRDLAANLVNTMPTMCHISEALSCPNLVQMYPRESYAFSMITNFDNIYTMMENNDQCVKYNLNYKNWWLLTGQYPKPE